MYNISLIKSIANDLIVKFVGGNKELTINKTNCISAYVLYAILSDRVKRQADEKNVGATVPHVNVADAKQFDVVLPPLELQNQFAAFVERVDKQKQTVQQSLEKLELMKKALMQEYFG